MCLDKFVPEIDPEHSDALSLLNELPKSRELLNRHSTPGTHRSASLSACPMPVLPVSPSPVPPRTPASPDAARFVCCRTLGAAPIVARKQMASNHVSTILSTEHNLSQSQLLQPITTPRSRTIASRARPERPSWSGTAIT